MEIKVLVKEESSEQEKQVLKRILDPTREEMKAYYEGLDQSDGHQEIEIKL